MSASTYHEDPTSTEAIDDEFRTQVASVMRRTVAQEPARRVPSMRECPWCAVSSDDRPERVEEELGRLRAGTGGRIPNGNANVGRRRRSPGSTFALRLLLISLIQLTGGVIQHRHAGEQRW